MSGYVCVDMGMMTVGLVFFFQAEDGIRDLVRSRGLGDVYKRQPPLPPATVDISTGEEIVEFPASSKCPTKICEPKPCLLYTSDAADERSSVDLGGRRIIKKKTKDDRAVCRLVHS